MNNVEEIAYKFAMGSIFALVMIFYTELQSIKRQQDYLEEKIEEILRIQRSF